jgi:hypothetical protein
MDRIELMMEADRRGILPPDQKALLNEAIKRGIVTGSTQEPAAVQAGRGLMEIPRQLGLTARHLMEGAGAAVAPIVEPLRLPMSLAARKLGYDRPIMNAEELMRTSADNLGLPLPASANERVVGDAVRMGTGAGLTSKGADLISKAVTSPTAQKVAQAAAANMGAQVAAGTGAGLAGGAVREAGGGDGAQFAASVVGGLGGAGAATGAAKIADVLSSGIQSLKARATSPTVTNVQVNLLIQEALKDSGIEFGQLPGLVQGKLQDEIKQALKTGREVNPEVIGRIADYAFIKATPTRGTATLDPVQITREKNLAKVGANSSSAALRELVDVQSNNNKRFTEVLNELNPTDMRQAGRIAGESIDARNNAASATMDALYKRARDSSGRPLDLDREGFITQAYSNLAQSNKGAFLPSEIQTIIKQIRTGQAVLDDGTKIPFPFNVDVIDNLKTTLSTAMRGAKDGNVKAAIRDVYKALDATTPKVQGAQVGGNQLVNPQTMQGAQAGADQSAAQAMAAFDRARRYAKAVFNWRESSPGITAALDGSNPETFVKDFIIGNTQKGQTANVESLLFTLKRDPETAQAVKGALVQHLKEAAIGKGNTDATANFSAPGFRKALDELGDAKLKLFFDKKEIKTLKALARVSSADVFQPRGSAVNNSNTTSAAWGLLERIAQSPLVNAIPFGKQIVREPVEFLTQRSAGNQAMNATGGISAPQSIPMARQRVPLNELLTPPVVLGGLLASPSNYGRDDDRRR